MLFMCTPYTRRTAATVCFPPLSPLNNVILECCRIIYCPGLPLYITATIQQAILTQPDCRVVLISNFKACQEHNGTQLHIPALVTVDIDDIMTEQTKEFKTKSPNMLNSDGKGELWYESTYRFLYLEDYMLFHNVTELIHFEADNMIYGKLTSALPGAPT